MKVIGGITLPDSSFGTVQLQIIEDNKGYYTCLYDVEYDVRRSHDWYHVSMYANREEVKELVYRSFYIRLGQTLHATTNILQADDLPAFLRRQAD